MKAVPFELVRATSVAEAADHLARGEGEAKLLAGGQSLVPMLSMRLVRPRLLVDLGRIPGLDTIRTDGDVLEIGAMTRQRAVERSPSVRRYVPLLAEAVGQIGHPSIRNRGTIGGSAAHADASAEIPAALLALDAVLVAQGRSGRREIPAAEFFTGFMSNALASDEMLVAIRLPRVVPLDRTSVREIARRAGDFATCGIQVAGTVVDGRITDPRVVAFGVTRTAARLPDVERRVAGGEPSPELFAEAARLPLPFDWVRSDVHGSAPYRRSLAAVLCRRALTDAFTEGA